MLDRNRPTLLDGAMGSALRDRGVEVPDYRSSIWSAQALMSAPDEVTALHRDYIRAGADVITVNNYAVTPASLASEGMAARLEELTGTACALARRARDLEGRPAAIAGSLPPLNTSYRADLVGPYDANLATYRTLARVLAPHVDMLICETMTTAVEARAAATAGAETGLPVWVCWTLAELPPRLAGGETIQDAVAALDDLPVAAVLFNCSSAGVITEALPVLRRCCSGPVGAYANPFWKAPDDGDYAQAPPNWLSPNAYTDAAKGWLRDGASIIGGCCGTNPDYIELLRDMINARSS